MKLNFTVKQLEADVLINMETLSKNKIKDIQEFCKLYKINIPIESEFDYYIDTLKKSKEFANIYENIDLFSQLEECCNRNENESVSKYKMKKLDEIVEYIENTKAYKKLQDFDYSNEKFISRDKLNECDGDMLCSLDFVSANFNALKLFDNEEELGNNWTHLCRRFAIYEALIASKSFRQIVFGNTNPKRLQKIQHINILKVYNHLLESGFPDKDVVFISPDELIIRVNKEDSSDIKSFSQFINNDKIGPGLSMPVKSKFFKIEKIKKNVFIKTFYHVEEISHGEKFLQEWFKVLHGVPGNKFFMYFKKYILNEPIDERDLVYINDGTLSKWVVEEDVKNKSILPHYEKHERVINMQEAEESFPYVWNSLSELLPHLSNEEKRRVIEIINNTCKYCYEQPVGCKCWNEE